jgi:hypothetical protein
MKADFSRVQLDPDKQDVAWLQQQGRVWLDSDWNESILSQLRLLELQTADIIGGSGRPDPGLAFTISPGAALDDFRIGGGHGAAGHMYVDGILTQNWNPNASYKQQAWTPGGPVSFPNPPPLPMPMLAQTGWSATGSMAGARAGHTATLLQDGRVLAVGGVSAGLPTALVEIYDPAHDRWAAAAKLQVARFGHSAVLLPDGRVLVAGGSGAGGIILASCEIYDATANTWTATGSLAAARYLHAGALAGSKVLVCGGVTIEVGSLASIPAPDILASSEVYDPLAGTWAATKPMAAKRCLHAIAVLPTGEALVSGGRSDVGSVNSSEKYSPANGSWSLVASMMAARERHTMSLLNDGRLLVAGGASAGLVLNSAEVYASTVNAWSQVPSMHVARSGHTASLLVHGRVLLAGGVTAMATTQASELFDPATSTWTQTEDMTQARWAHTATVLPNKRVLVAGGTSRSDQSRLDPSNTGSGPSGELASAELYEPSAATWGVAYLEVWRRLITYLQDDSIREIALGGPDTTARLRTVAQVKVTPVPADQLPSTLDCEHAWAYLPRYGRGTLSTLPLSVATTPSDCDLPDAGSYTGRENRLYRVEIHSQGEMLGAVEVTDLLLTADAHAGATRLTVAQPLAIHEAASLVGSHWDIGDGSGTTQRREALLIRDAVPGATHVDLAVPLLNSFTVAARTRLIPYRGNVPLRGLVGPGNTTLYVDPAHAARFAAQAVGPMAAPAWFIQSEAGDSEAISIVQVDTQTGAITLAQPLQFSYPLGISEIAPWARFKWSRNNAGFAVGAQVQTVAMGTSQTTLQVDSLGRDSATVLKKGDLVELSSDSDDLGFSAGLLCRILDDPDPDNLIVTLDSADLRYDPTLNPGINSDHLVLRRWDGAGLMVPDQQVDLGDGVSLKFGGFNFRSGDYWWFITRAIDGSLQQLEDAPPIGIVRKLCPLAILRWTGDLQSGVVLDQITDCVPLFDTLSGIEADDIAFDDSHCNLHAKTVQEALDALCAKPTLPVVVAGGLNWANDRDLLLSHFNAGLSVTFSEAMHAATINKSTFQVTLELPASAGALPMHQAFIVNGAVKLSTNVATFTPDPLLTVAKLHEWIKQEGALLQDARLLGRVVLKGSFILDAAGQRALDGEVLGKLAQRGYELYTDLRLPSGDSVEGGDFESWFFLAPPSPPAQVSQVMPAALQVLKATPTAIQVSFSKDVLWPSLRSDNFFVMGPRSTQIFGEIEPYPFAKNPEVVSGATLRPDPKLITFGAVPGRRTQYTVILLGTGPNPITDVDGLPLDGAGNGGSVASDFSSTYALLLAGRPG